MSSDYPYTGTGMNLSHLELLTVKEVAKLLRLSKAAVYGLITNQSLPIFRFGGAIRVSHHQLEEFIHSSSSEQE